jgi:hypothetical protein
MSLAGGWVAWRPVRRRPAADLGLDADDFQAVENLADGMARHCTIGIQWLRGMAENAPSADSN